MDYMSLLNAFLYPNAPSRFSSPSLRVPSDEMNSRSNTYSGSSCNGLRLRALCKCDDVGSQPAARHIEILH